MNLFSTVRRWGYVLRTFRNHARMLNRRSEVESVLLDVANGKRGALTPAECRTLAFRLAGVV